MKTYEIKMSRSRWMSLIIAVMLIAMIVQLCLPYFSYGKDAMTFVPPEGGNEAMLNGKWILSGSDPSADGYKEIEIKSGKMTVNTTNIIRVNQLAADEAVDTVKADFDKIVANATGSEEAYLKVLQINDMTQKVYEFVAEKCNVNASAAAVVADASSGEAAASGSEDFDSVAANKAKVENQVSIAKTNYESAFAAIDIARASVATAREGAVDAYKADASYAWINETTEAKTEALYDEYLPAYAAENTARVRKQLEDALVNKELDALKKAEKDTLKAANPEKTSKEIDAMIDTAKLKNQIDMAAITAAVSDDAVEEEMMKQFATMLDEMLGDERDSAIYNKLDEYKAVAAAGVAKAQSAVKAADDAAKEAEKTYFKKADKAKTDAIKEYNKAVAIALKLDPTAEFVELSKDGAELEAAVSEIAPLDYQEYEKDNTEKAMMSSEGKAKYTEKKSLLKLTFANGEEYEVDFASSFQYNGIKKLSILGYVGFPYNVEDFTNEMIYRIKDFYINDVVLLPIVLLVMAILGVLLCYFKKDNMFSGVIPAAFGIVGVIGYLCSDFLKLGDRFLLHVICYAVITVFSAIHIWLCVREKKASK